MLETGTSGLMSGEGKRVGYLSVPITRPSSTLRPELHGLHACRCAIQSHRAYAQRWGSMMILSDVSRGFATRSKASPMRFSGNRCVTRPSTRTRPEVM